MEFAQIARRLDTLAGKNHYHVDEIPNGRRGVAAVICHECLMAGAPREVSTGLCRFCFVALCKSHLIELYRDPPSFPQYTCRHLPGSGPTPASGRRAEAAPSVQLGPRTERAREPILSRGLVPRFGSI
jgi:hypothetical protein